MLLAVLSGFLLAAAAPWLHARLGGRVHWLLALLPAALAVYFASHLPAVIAGAQMVRVYPWVPGLDIHLSFLIDGLSLLFALLISVIGTFIVLYAGEYLRGDRDLARFYVFILAFMASMLGLVLSDNLIALFVFWELTSITSYLLIGYNHEDARARYCALQGLIVTVAGGMALLAGFVVLALMSGSWELSQILTQGEVLREHPWYLLALLLLLGGAFTKSAQFPFHFWLPNAMAAPTPVSAYLHSATMVKAGIYLLARLHPGLGGTPAWETILPLVGGITMLLGMVLAYRSTEFKRLLAYTTVMALGTLTLLIGIGTPYAITAAMTFLLAHALYKAALFLVAGAVDHGTGIKDITRLGGLRHAMPITATTAILAALSMAGIAPLFGFIAKEMLFEAVLGAPYFGGLLTVFTVLTAMLGVALGAVVALRPFFGALKPTPQHPHEAPLPMWIGSALLAAAGLALGLLPFVAERGLVAAAVSAVYGVPLEIHLTLWHGFDWPLALSALSIAAGAAFYVGWDALRGRTVWMNRAAAAYGPERGYDLLMQSMVATAEWQSRVLQNGYLRRYLITILLTLVTVVGYTMLTRGEPRVLFNFTGWFLIDVIVAALIVAGAMFAAGTRSRLGAVASLGVVGFGVALMFVLYSAPDLGITQVLVETLTVLLLVLVLFRLPGFSNRSGRGARALDASVAVLVGGLFTVLLMATIDVQFHDPISQYFIAHSVDLAHGRNIVNVILVDFRALDTLGEIFVLALAAIGVYAMIKLKAEDRR
ncbi:putative monovalent cation/H+ antiporter subunit A [Ectothiorhodospiraceae bacterium 2226]|nr:putative monovalent cation/H+ antiporter subunit A [Ectothiorhodospiraceae bacterium 2226]